MADRRHFGRRAEVFSRVVEWIREQRIPGRSVPPGVTEAGAAQRILTRLAFRGLVRRVNGGWLPTPILLTSAELVSD